MTAQDPVKDNIIYVGGDAVYQYEGEDPRDILERSNKKAFIPYQVGCWVTAWARYRLEQGIRAVYENGGTVCYCDTDSVKFYGMNSDIKAAFDLFNIRASKAAEEGGIIAKDAKGKLHPAGVYEADGYYRTFKTLGAKKYVYEDDTGLHITIAGVNKKQGAKELGSIDNFHNGFSFTKAGGLEAVYNDNINITRTIDGHLLKITDNVCLRPSTYTIGMTQDYIDLLFALSREMHFGPLL